MDVISSRPDLIEMHYLEEHTINYFFVIHNRVYFVTARYYLVKYNRGAAALDSTSPRVAAALTIVRVALANKYNCKI